MKKSPFRFAPSLNPGSAAVAQDRPCPLGLNQAGRRAGMRRPRWQTRLAGWGVLALGLFAGPLRAENWPAWRGAGGTGVAAGKPPPLELAGNLLWKVELPGRGCSTPIIWNGRVLVTSPIGDQDGLLAYDAAGKELWRRTFGAMIPGRGQRVGSAANSSPVTDGEVVVVYFKSGTVACLDLDGKPRWQINLQERYGKDTLWWDQGTSPVFAAGRVVIAVMQTGGESYLVSLDKQTGKEVWRTVRKYQTGDESGDAYTTPQVVKVNDVEQIVSWGADHLTGHDAASGKLVWECGGFNPKRTNNQRVIASAVGNDTLAVVPFNRGEALAAIRLDGRGDVSASHWVWRDDKLGTDAATPVLHGGKLIVLKDSGPKRGRLTCLEALTGKQVWEASLPKAPQVFYASPLLAGDRLFCVREDGMVISGRITDTGLEDLKTHPLEEGVIASPVSVAGRLYLRGDKHLFCFGEK
jgi:outer membrane protein assembly factor BamB